MLYLIVGHREVEMNHALNLVPFWRVEYYTCSASLPIGQFVRMDIPLRMLFCPLAFHIGELCNEVNDQDSSFF